MSSSGLVVLLSGPNLNLLGDREPDVYGPETLADHVATATKAAAGLGLDLEHLQTNHEGELVEAVQAARGRAVAIIVNAGALSHTSWSLHDALAAFGGVVVELHLSNPAGPRAVPSPVGDRPGGRRLHRRIRWVGLRTGGGGGPPHPCLPIGTLK